MTYTKEIKRKAKLLILSYGFLPFLYLIDKYEKKQEFEKCKLLFDSLEEQSKHLNLVLPTKYSKNAAKVVAEEFEKHGMMGTTALLNTPFYAIEIEKKLELAL